ncbi:MAG: site-specific DNA-methyltransferase [Elusimicrobiota bacterium]|jgi:modification methylase|nr:site-specific DNA-methyltransferase [Elusimicrobiota bacterium]
MVNKIIRGDTLMELKNMMLQVIKKQKANIKWDRGIAANIRGWRFWQTEERIYWLYKPSFEGDLIGPELDSKDALLTSVWKIRPENKNPHPAPFPIELPVRCILAALDNKKCGIVKNGVVIDPYSGSGTTLVAAKLLGHNYLGIEISGSYADYASSRLLNANFEMKRVLEEKSLHIVKESFTKKKMRGLHKDKTQNSNLNLLFKPNH